MSKNVRQLPAQENLSTQKVRCFFLLIPGAAAPLNSYIPPTSKIERGKCQLFLGKILGEENEPELRCSTNTLSLSVGLEAESWSRSSSPPLQDILAAGLSFSWQSGLGFQIYPNPREAKQQTAGEGSSGSSFLSESQTLVFFSLKGIKNRKKIYFVYFVKKK